MFKKTPVSFSYKALALLHIAVGLILYWEPMRVWVQAGFFNAIDPHWDRMATFWFLLCGWLMYQAALLIEGYERRAQPLPRPFLASWVAFGVFSSLAMPLSGLPLVALLAITAFVRQRRRSALSLNTSNQGGQQ